MLRKQGKASKLITIFLSSAYQHLALQLLIGGGNLFILGILPMVRVVCWMITGLFTLIGLSAPLLLGNAAYDALWQFVDGYDMALDKVLHTVPDVVYEAE